VVCALVVKALDRVDASRGPNVRWRRRTLAARQGIECASRRVVGATRHSDGRSLDLDVLIGTDDVALELVLAGAVGWVSGCTNAFPAACLELYAASLARDLGCALALYRLLHPLLRWDSKVDFVQAIKLSMDAIGRYGGRTRPPRQALTPGQEATVRAATEKAIAEGCC
jgi:dihydrodipicolinate synthase/N-acetylneuraminate lyase